MRDNNPQTSDPSPPPAPPGSPGERRECPPKDVDNTQQTTLYSFVPTGLPTTLARDVAEEEAEEDLKRDGCKRNYPEQSLSILRDYRYLIRVYERESCIFDKLFVRVIEGDKSPNRGLVLWST